MIALAQYYWDGLIAALLIGLGTAWWIWRRKPAALLIEFDPNDEPIIWPGRERVVPKAEPAPPPILADDPAEYETSAAPFAEQADGELLVEDRPAPHAEEETAPAADDLTRIKGISGPIAALLHDLGITRFGEIARWMPEDIERIDGSLGLFKGHILRDEWIAQARLLAKGDLTTFNQRYGHL